MHVYKHREIELQMSHITLTVYRNDVSTQIANLKCTFTDHKLRWKDNRCNNKSLHQRPWKHKRARRRQQMRWTDDLKKHPGKEWMQTAHNRKKLGRERKGQYPKMDVWGRLDIY